MDGPSAQVRLLAAPAQLEGDDEAPISGTVVLTGFWDGRPLSCDFKSEQIYDVLPKMKPTRLKINDSDNNAVCIVKVGESLSKELQQPTLFGDLFEACGAR